MRKKYAMLIEGNPFPSIQEDIGNKKKLDRDLQSVIKYFGHFLQYTDSLRILIQAVAEDIIELVNKTSNSVQAEKREPLTLIILLLLFIPICIWVTLNSTGSMMRYSRLYNERVEVYNSEKKKTDKLLSSLLPRSIIRQMKRGVVPQPKLYIRDQI
ncbi:uncharacterized protein LOC111715822 [Eurytemora carolleeae]|uniref:uncharacterized protein LOC111715822 n=1 Tax=Eurytemora carolleeae TaxID=1294199 RepID=UPI000C75B4E3|nr:uncharacterized protein LOC111715822 [Eurytemora carolleeae]|eukprot:XP_023346968.1 uncharacterized protein LOC111715822 [Eurytemora affinis]